MAEKLYLPRTLAFTIPTIDPKSVSGENMYLLKDRVRTEAEVSLNSTGRKIRFLPLSPYEDCRCF